jgi:hypothetical protein
LDSFYNLLFALQRSALVAKIDAFTPKNFVNLFKFSSQIFDGGSSFLIHNF